MGVRAYGGYVRGHQGQRFFLAVLPLAETHNGLRQRGVNHEMESPQPFDGQDLAPAQQIRRLGDGVLARQPASLSIKKGYLWTALPAGVRLCMKTAIHRVVVFRFTFPTHREGSHGGLGAVVRDVFYYGVAWPAIGAVDEGVTISAILPVHDLG